MDVYAHQKLFEWIRSLFNGLGYFLCHLIAKLITYQVTPLPMLL